MASFAASIDSLEQNKWLTTRKSGLEASFTDITKISETRTSVVFNIKIDSRLSRADKTRLMNSILDSGMTLAARSASREELNLTFLKSRNNYFKLGDDSLLQEKDDYWNLTIDEGTIAEKSYYISKTGFWLSNEIEEQYALMEWEMHYNDTWYTSQEQVWNWSIIQNTSTTSHLKAVAGISNETWVAEFFIEDGDTHLGVSLYTENDIDNIHRLHHYNINISNDTTTDYISVGGIDHNLSDVQDLNYTNISDFIMFDSNKFIDVLMDNMEPNVVNVGQRSSYIYTQLHNFTFLWTDPDALSHSGQYRFEEGSGTVAEDTSDHENNLTINGGAVYIGSKGTNGTGNFSLSLDGIDDHASHPSAFGFDRFDNFSVTFWVNTTGDDQTIISKRAAGGGGTPGWQIHIPISQPGSIFVEFRNSNPNRIQVETNGANFTQGDWAFIAMTYDGSSTAEGIDVYFNAVNQTLITNVDALTGSMLTPAQFSIGSRDNSQHLLGSIDEVNIFNRTLTQEEIDNIFEIGQPELIDNPPEVTLISPPDNNITNITAVTFECNAVDDINLSSISLYHNQSGVFQLNETQFNAGLNVTVFFNQTIDYNHTIVWNCEANDSLGNTSFAPANFTLTINQTFPPPIIPPNETAPAVVLDTPVNINVSSPVTFLYNVSGNDVENCSVFINGTLQFIDTTITNNATNQFTLTFPDNGTFAWQVSCIDVFGNIGNSTNETFFVRNPPPFQLFSITSCPTTTSGALILALLFFIAAFFIAIGAIMQIGFIGFFGAILLMVSSWFLSPCVNLIAFAVGLTSFALIAYFAIIGLGFKNDPFR